jgi:hypothetical protein
MSSQSQFQSRQHLHTLFAQGRPLARYAMHPFPSAPHRTDRTTFAVVSSPVISSELCQ